MHSLHLFILLAAFSLIAYCIIIVIHKHSLHSGVHISDAGGYD